MSDKNYFDHFQDRSALSPRARIFRVAFCFWVCFHGQASFAQKEKFFDVWKVEAGPTVSLPQWAFKMFNSAGVGVDIGVTRSFPKVKNLYFGGRIFYTYYFAKKHTDIGFGSATEPFHMIGVVADAHYIFRDRYVGGVNLGIGIPTIQYDGIGLARTAYIGYRLPVQEHFLTPAFYMNRTTYATWNIGLRVSYSF
jgi:hypothetical protein